MDYELERKEAISAGRDALRSLEDTKAALKSAKNFGIWDMLGGGTFVSLFKHGKLDEAQRCAERAYRDIMRFERELKDVRLDMNLDVDVGMLLKGLDIFYDSFIADVLVQSKIHDAMDKIDCAIEIINKLIKKI